MKKNKNVIIVEKDVQIAKGVFLSEGDAFIKTRQGWALVEADDEDETDVDETDDDIDEETDDDDDVDGDDK